MKTSLQRHRTQAGTRQSAFRIFVVALWSVLMVASGLLISRNFFQRSGSIRTSIPADSYLGVIQLAPDQHGRCEQFELDNKSAVLKAKGSAPCLDITATVSRPNSGPSVAPPASGPSGSPPNSGPLGGSIGRMNGIGNHFKTRW